MARYIVKRLIYLVFVFFLLSIIMFAIYQMVPGDRAAMMIDESIRNKNPELYQRVYEQARRDLGLDKPVYVQYFLWIGKMLTGDFGYSGQHKMPVKDVVATPLWNTVKLNILNLILVFIITIPLGITTAVRKFSLYDNVVQVGTVIGMSIPSFVLALVFICFFAVKFPIFPISGMVTAGAEFESGWAEFLDKLWHMLLPVIVMTVSSLAGITRYIRSAMSEELTKDYIRTARAKGLKEKVVIYSHAFRNSLIIVVSIFAGWFLSIFGGSVVIESMFLYKGIGEIMITGLKTQDFSIVLAMNMFYVLLSLVGNLLTDLCYTIVDPRVKLT